MEEKLDRDLEPDYTDDEYDSAHEKDESADDELIRRIYSDFNMSKSRYARWRTDMAEVYDFFAGQQWSEEDKADLNEQNRPVVVFNRVARVVNAVSGLELQNRQEARFNPRKMGQVAAIDSDILTSAVKYHREACDAEDEESEAFQDTLICGMGWIETRLDYETNEDGMALIERVDPGEMYPDPKAKKRNLDDATFLIRAKKMSYREFKKRWPGANLKPGISFTLEDDGKQPHDADPQVAYKQSTDSGWNDRDTITVLQYQYFDLVDFYRLENKKTKEILNVTEEIFNSKKKEIKATGMAYVKQTRRVYKQAFAAGGRILEKGECAVNRMTLRCITGLRNRNDGTWFGIVNLMMDPQRWANKWLSQTLHIVNTGAKGGLLAEDGAISDQRDFEENWAKPGSISYVVAGALTGGRVIPKQPPPYPDGVDRLLQFAIQSINDVVGVNPELLGNVGKDQAVYVEDSRKKAGVTILATFFDALRRYRKEQGRVIADFVIKYMSDGRLIKVVDSGMEKYVPLFRKTIDFDYDIAVDDAPSSPNMKERVFSLISNLMPSLMQAGIPIPPEIIDYAPLPEGLAQKWKGMIANTGNSPENERAKQMEELMTMLAAKKLESEIALNNAKAMKEQALAADEGAQAQDKLGLNVMQTVSKDRTMKQDQERKDLEMLLEQDRKDAAFEMDIKRQREEQLIKQLQSNQIMQGEQV